MDDLNSKNTRYDQLGRRLRNIKDEREQLRNIQRNRHDMSDWSREEVAFVRRALSELYNILKLLLLIYCFLESDSGRKHDELESEYKKLQSEIIDLDSELVDINTKITKFQTAPATTAGGSLGRDFFYDQTRTPDEILREIISHLNDFHRCQ